MIFSSTQIGLTQATVYDISAADLAGANSGQRPDLLAKTQAIFRTPDGKTYSANAARNQLVAAAVPVTVATDPLTGGNASLITPTGSVRIPLLLSADDTAAAAQNNAAIIQAAFDAGGYYVLQCNGIAQISTQIIARGNTNIDFAGVELKARTAIGSLIVTSPYIDAGVTVTVAWSAGTTATVTWAAHGFTAGQHVWLNRADQAQFCGVFRVESVTDANTFVVQLMRLPTTTATGTITGRRAIENLTITSLIANYNAGTNTGTGNNLHALVLAGVWNLKVDGVFGKSTQKYLVCSGALSKYTFRNIGGAVLNSDALKVYGPAFGGIIEGIYASKSGDDFVSFQTREPSAYVAYDFCHGDVLGATVRGLTGTSQTGAFLLYASPYGVIDGISIDNSMESMGTSVPHCRLETLYTSGTCEIGNVAFTSAATEDQQTLISLGNSANALIVRNLTLISPIARSAAFTARVINLAGSNVNASINVIGGYAIGLDNLVNCGANTGRISVSLVGTRLGSNYTSFRAGSAGFLDVNLSGVVFENNFGTQFLSAPAGSGILRISSQGTVNINGGAVTYSMGAGSSLRLGGNCDLPLDGSLLDAAVANHAAGAGFYNTNAAFGAGVGYYVRGSTTWTRTAA